jgi:hypothetical protein
MAGSTRRLSPVRFPPRARQALHVSSLHGVHQRGLDDGNGPREAEEGRRGLLARRKDHIHVEPHEFAEEVGQALCLPLGGAPLDHDVLALHVSQLMQAFQERTKNGTSRLWPGHVGGRRSSEEDADPPHLPRLRLSGERRGEGTGQRGQQEASAVHAGR